MILVLFRVGGVVFSLLGVSWRLLARFWVPLGASAARFEAPGLPRKPPASILGAIFDAFLKIVEVFFVWFSAFLFNDFSSCFSKGFSWILLFFSFRAKTADTRKMQYLPHENLLFQGARLRRRSGEGEETIQTTHKKKASTNI